MNLMNIEFKENENKYITIYKEIKKRIHEGLIKENEKLPSKRALAKHLMISNNTVMSAYYLLESEGYIYAVEKSGYYVSDTKYYHHDKEMLHEQVSKTYLYDYTSEFINKDLFPSFTLRKLIQDNMITSPEIWLKKSPFQGDTKLRTTIALYLYENKGMEVNSSNIVIVSGIEESLTILSNILSIKHIGIENPSYKKVYDFFDGKDFTLFDVDEEGIVLDKKVPLDLIYVTPYNQFPTGVKMSSKRKKELLSYPTMYILEDDFDCDLISQNKIMSTLFSLNASKVIYHGSFTHTICPGLRLSYLVLPNKLLPVYQEKYKNSSCHISSLDQALIESFISGGYYYRHLTHIRKDLKEKKNIIHDYLIDNNISFKESPLSFYIKVTNKELLKDCFEKESIKIHFLSEYSIHKLEDYLILNFISIKKEDLIKSLVIISKIIREDC